MTKDDCKKLVIDIISDIAPDEDLSTIKSEIRLRDQLQLDSMDFLDIVMELRKRHGIEVPEAEPEVLPLLTVLPLQLLAYYMADLKGTDVDQPRNLAKTVTVE